LLLTTNQTYRFLNKKQALKPVSSKTFANVAETQTAVAKTTAATSVGNDSPIKKLAPTIPRDSPNHVGMTTNQWSQLQQTKNGLDNITKIAAAKEITTPTRKPKALAKNKTPTANKIFTFITLFLLYFFNID